MEKNTAILVFARSARHEMRYKILHANKRVNQQLHTALFNKTITTVEATGLPYFVIDEKQQNGLTFGEKFTNAFEKIFNIGYENVIAVGSDCVNLSTLQIDTANKNLQNNICTFGPDFHNGIYLIGLNKNCFNKEVLASLNWCSKKLLSQLSNYFQTNNILLHHLQKLADVNISQEFSYILKKEIHSSFIKFICHLLLSLNRLFSPDNISFRKTSCKLSLILRGPPAAAF